MKRTLAGLVAAMAFSGTVAAQTPAPDPKLAAQGKKLYATYKCDKCHQIDGRGSKKGPLDGVALKLSAADIKKWLVSPAEMEAKLEKPPKGTDSMANALKTKGIEPGEVDALVAYMLTLNKKK
jgi:mono/diheme cytochrome c family protein